MKRLSRVGLPVPEARAKTVLRLVATGFATGMALLLAACSASRPRTFQVHNASPSHRQAAAPRSSSTSAGLSRGILPSPADSSTPTVGVTERQAPVEPPTEGPEWVLLRDWAHSNPPIDPRALGPGQTAWELTSTSGTLHLIASTRQARYEGVDLWLGHAPAPDPAGLRVHRLDLSKNIRPLVLQAPLTRSALGRIVLDPGHGGEALGTRSVLDGRQEKEFTLDWALRLAPLLAAKGWQVTLTRTNDVEVSLAERVAIADRARADLFVSLHFNSAAPNLTQSGIETYCLTPTGLPSTLVRESEDDPRLAYPNNRFDEANLQWAARIHRTLIGITGSADRGIRRARFMAVLRNQERAAVLVEGGFLSHPQEARRIADPAYRQLLAEALANALVPDDLPPSRLPGGSRLLTP